MNKQQKEQAKKIGIITIILVVVVLFLAPGLFESLGAYFTGEITNCVDTPYLPACICSAGYQKVAVGWNHWECKNEIVFPSSYDFPLQTWGEAYAFAEDQMGDVECTGEFFYRQEYSLNEPLPTNVDMIVIECAKQFDFGTGQTAWNVYFDQEDGFVYQLFCNNSFANFECPANIPFRVR